jgi:UDP-N-acetylmuramate--alanine ligase
MRKNEVDWRDKLQPNQHIHLIGIGGMGMAGLAVLLHERGLQVSGCDATSNRQTAYLQARGIPVELHHDAVHLEGCDLLIRSSAVSLEMDEVQEAIRQGIPVVQRGYVLAELVRDRICIAVAGSHGKTSTAAILAQVLQSGFAIGGEIGGDAALARDGAWMVTELDESDGTLTQFQPDYTILTNVDDDHLDHHGSRAQLNRCFEQLIFQTKKTVFYDATDSRSVALCAAHKNCLPIQQDADAKQIPFPGAYNQKNAAAALMVADQFVPRKISRDRLAEIEPIRRRFESLYRNKGVQIITDYAHHPTEINALIEAVRECKEYKRILAIFQPHRYSRTNSLKAEFATVLQQLDQVILVPVYSASEPWIEGGDSSDILTICHKQGWNHIHEVEQLEGAWMEMVDSLRSGDLLLLIGAGNIDQLRSKISQIEQN